MKHIYRVQVHFQQDVSDDIYNQMAISIGYFPNLTKAKQEVHVYMNRYKNVIQKDKELQFFSISVLPFNKDLDGLKWDIHVYDIKSKTWEHYDDQREILQLLK